MCSEFAGGTFLRLKPFVIIFLRKLCHIDSIFINSFADNSHAWTLYKSLLGTHASKIVVRVDIVKFIHKDYDWLINKRTVIGHCYVIDIRLLIKCCMIVCIIRLLLLL